MKANLLALLTTLFITHLSLSARIVEVPKYDAKLKIKENESFRLLFYGAGSSYGSVLQWDYENENGDNNITVILARASQDQHTFSPLIIEGPGCTNPVIIFPPPSKFCPPVRCKNICLAGEVHPVPVVRVGSKKMSP